LTEVGTPWLVTIAAGLVLLSLIGFLGWFALQLLAQNGRALSRLEAVESSLKAISVGLGLDSSDPSPDVPAFLGKGLSGGGLPVGSAAPPFSLDVAGGGHLALSDLLAEQRPLVLVFVSVGCGPCEVLLPRLGEWQDRFRDRLTLAVVASGRREDLDGKASQHRLRPVLVQAEREVAEAFAAYGTPSAVVVGADGSVLSPTVGGTEQIATLVQQAAAYGAGGLRWRGPAQVPEEPERPASPLGAPAPDVVLHDLDGREVALSDFYRGTRLLLFWNPGCGYCRRMLPRLQGLGEGRPGSPPPVVVVSTGEVADIREQAIPGPLLHDPNGLAMQAFGARGTPMGVLVEEGEVASPVVAGAEAVLQLLVEAELASTNADGRDPGAVAGTHIATGDRMRNAAAEALP
jgi:thiol-disulfide isomerase/thioredoxin